MAARRLACVVRAWRDSAGADGMDVHCGRFCFPRKHLDARRDRKSVVARRGGAADRSVRGDGGAGKFQIHAGRIRGFARGAGGARAVCGFSGRAGTAGARLARTDGRSDRGAGQEQLSNQRTVWFLVGGAVFPSRAQEARAPAISCRIRRGVGAGGGIGIRRAHAQRDYHAGADAAPAGLVLPA